jgi:hypothetical protein
MVKGVNYWRGGSVDRMTFVMGAVNPVLFLVTQFMLMRR